MELLQYYKCKSCGAYIMRTAPPDGICNKCLTDDRITKKRKKDKSILHRISSEVVEELDRIAEETGKKRAKLIDEAIDELIRRYNFKSVVRTCEVCGRMFRAETFERRVCDRCKRKS